MSFVKNLFTIIINIICCMWNVKNNVNTFTLAL